MDIDRSRDMDPNDSYCVDTVPTDSNLLNIHKYWKRFRPPVSKSGWFFVPPNDSDGGTRAFGAAK